MQFAPVGQYRRHARQRLLHGQAVAFSKFNPFFNGRSSRPPRGMIQHNAEFIRFKSSKEIRERRKRLPQNVTTEQRMLKKSTQENYADIGPWVKAAVSQEDAKPQNPMWNGEPSEEKVSQWQQERIRFLRNPSREVNPTARLGEP
jgi:hypothetical protein